MIEERFLIPNVGMSGDVVRVHDKATGRVSTMLAYNAEKTVTGDPGRYEYWGPHAPLPPLVATGPAPKAEEAAVTGLRSRGKSASKAHHG
jgi:hypothetical protein